MSKEQIKEYMNLSKAITIMDKGLLYYAGFGAGILYLVGDLVGGFITPNYNYIKNAVSELIQSGAEYRVLLSSFLFLHALMIILFSIGLLTEHPYKQSKLIFIGGILLLAVGISHALSSSIFPQDPVGAESTFPGVMHLILVGITVVSIFVLMPLIGVGVYQLYGWKHFVIFTFLCLAVIIISGVSSPIVISKGIEVMGLTERITGYSFYIWMFVLAYLLIKEQSAQILPDF
ncbi:MAG: DUF998 domain-containing protein [Anaerolineales bacterium]|nr:DUF998 domain-containing protein [Anaerolineales bacterium]